MDKKVVVSCDYSEIEKIIHNEFGHTYEIMPMEEVGSSQYAAVYEQEVSKGALNEFEQKDIEKMYAGTPAQYCLSSLTTHLANLGKLEEGSYLIDVSW